MSALTQLTPSEVLFVGGETSNVYQHGVGLVLLDTRGLKNYGFDTFRRHMEKHIPRIPQLRWKLHQVPLGLDLPYWVEDRKFNLDNHIRRIAVPPPGDDRALADIVAYIYCRHLDRSRPPWEFWFIEGLAGGRFAFLQKLHHCMADGEGATRMMEVLWDHEPGGLRGDPGSAPIEARAGEVPDAWQQSLNGFRHLARLPFSAAREVYELVQHEVDRRLSGVGDKAGPKSAPPTCFNGDISADRAFAFTSLPITRIKSVKNAFGATVNDVILALVSGSLRQYLSKRGELPAESLRTSIAVSLRTEQDEDFSNRVTVVPVTLATNIADPLERLQAIAEDCRRAKEQAHHGGKGVLEFMQIFPPLAVNVLTRLTPADQVPRLMGVNLVVSNVRGSDTPMYVGGALAEAVYPMSIISPGGGLNVTCLSYNGKVDFGLTVEPNMIPDPEQLGEGLQHELEVYAALVPEQRRRRKSRR